MIGTLTWRLKEAIAVLAGKKKTVAEAKSISASKDFGDLTTFEITDQKMLDYLNSLTIEFCFSEFGENRVNAGGAEFSSKNRLEPSLSTLRKYFPNAKYTVYSDFDLEIPGVTLKKIIASPMQNDDHPRHFYRTADYFKFKSLLDSEADFKCVVDTDMFVVSEEIYRLVYLTEIFGFCAPYNSRNLLKNDMKISLDTKNIDDFSNGFGHSYNQSPMTLWKNHEAGRTFFEKCCENMRQEPSRASRVMWNAAKETGVSPYLLPQQFCVCTGDEGIGNEVVLHVGHPSVAEYYKIKF